MEWRREIIKSCLKKLWNYAYVRRWVDYSTADAEFSFARARGWKKEPKIINAKQKKPHVFFDSYNSVDEDHEHNPARLFCRYCTEGTKTNVETAGCLTVADHSFLASGIRMTVEASSLEMKRAFEQLVSMRMVIGSMTAFEAPVGAYCRKSALPLGKKGIYYPPRQSSYFELVLPDDLKRRLVDGSRAANPMLREWVTCRVELHGTLTRDVL